LLESGQKKRKRTRSISHSEVIALVVYFHQMGYRTFKWFYQKYAVKYLSSEFPTLPRYNRFIELMLEVLIPLTAFMQKRCQSRKGIAFVEATPLRVCQKLRIPRHKTFKEVAGRSKSSTGWFYGFKLHLVVDDKGEIISFMITRGKVDDRTPVPTLVKNYRGKLFGDKGYVSKKRTKLLLQDSVERITTLRKNRKPRLLKALDKLLLRKRSSIETMNDQLKNSSQIEHSRHRSLTNGMINVVAGLVGCL
jgi:hypothetical protein